MHLRKRTLVIALIAAVLLGAGVAGAAWLVEGTGPGTTKAATAVALTVTAGSPSATLTPGGSGPVSAMVSNPNPFPVQLLSARIGTVAAAPLTGKTCAASNVTATTPITLATPVTLPANSGPTAITVPAALQMLTTAEDGCQGATFTVQLTLSGQSV